MNYNDPFDSKWNPLWPVLDPNARKRFEEMYIEALLDESSWPDDADPEWRLYANRVRSNFGSTPIPLLKEAIATLGRQIVGRNPFREYENHLAFIQRNLRVTCFSEEEASLLMWSHYAESHKGAVLEFDTHLLVSSWRRRLVPVQYLGILPQVVEPESWWKAAVYRQPYPFDPIEIIDKLLTTKHECWSYEKEWRVVSLYFEEQRDLFEDLPFPTEALVSIRYGCGSSNEFVETVSGLLQEYPSVRVGNMRKRTDSFALVSDWQE